MADNYVSVNSAGATGDTKMQTYLNTIASSDVHAEAVVLVNSSGSPLTTFPVSGPMTNTELRSSDVNVSGTFWQTTQPVSGTVNIGNFPATQPISGSVNVGNFPAIQPVSQSGDWTVKSPNASNFLASVSGTVTATQGGTWYVQSINSTTTVNSPNASNFLATVSGTVGITANSTVDMQKIVGTTVDVNSGTKSAGTQRVVLATDQPQLTNKLLVTPDANTAFNLAQIAGTAPAASVAGVLDIVERKRTASTGLSPTYVSGKINTSTTTQITQSTCYLSSLQLSIYTAGTTWAVNVTDRQTGAAGPLPIVPNFVVTALVGANNPMTLAYAEPIICTSGINVITVGGAPGNIAYFATYWS